LKKQLRSLKRLLKTIKDLRFEIVGSTIFCVGKVICHCPSHCKTLFLSGNLSSLPTLKTVEPRFEI
jgi:hypothetical protein